MKVKLLYAPTTCPDLFLLSAPPLGISIISAYLKYHEIDCDIDDLEIKLNNFNKISSDTIDISLKGYPLYCTTELC